MALLLAIIALTIMGVMLADMMESTSTTYSMAVQSRDRLRAEYLAKSSLNLTRLLMSQDGKIRDAAAPMFQLLTGRPPPQGLPIYQYAGSILAPFCDYESLSEGEFELDFSKAEGLGKTGGTCHVVSFAENSRINVSKPLFFDGDSGYLSISMQMFAMMGGYHSPSPYDVLFENRDPDGNFSPRLDIVGSIIDWWDQDTTRLVFDPGASTVSQSGAEDDVYSRFDDPYVIKNAPLDSIEELRMVRGISDDFWATFLEPNPDDPASRTITIYASGGVNVNEADPSVLLARVCSFVPQTTLCADPTESAKFIQIFRTMKSLAPIPWFSQAGDFLTFIQGKGGPRDLYTMMISVLGQDNPLLFKPIAIPGDTLNKMSPFFVAGARIISINTEGVVGRSKVRMKTVVNFDEQWNVPPPNVAPRPTLGAMTYYRME